MFYFSFWLSQDSCLWTILNCSLPHSFPAPPSLSLSLPEQGVRCAEDLRIWAGRWVPDAASGTAASIEGWGVSSCKKEPEQAAPVPPSLAHSSPGKEELSFCLGCALTLGPESHPEGGLFSVRKMSEMPARLARPQSLELPFSGTCLSFLCGENGAPATHALFLLHPAHCPSSHIHGKGPSNVVEQWSSRLPSLQ